MKLQKQRNLAIFLFAAYFLSGIYFVAPAERSVLRSFGKVIGSAEPGLHYRLPFPLTKLDKVQVRHVRRISVGAGEANIALSRAPDRQGEFVSADQNIIHLMMTVQYVVADSAAYLFRAKDADVLLNEAATAVLSHVANATPIDAIMTSGKHEFAGAVRVALDEIAARYQVGIVIRSVSLERATPPAEVAEAFRDVTNAREDRDRITNEADGYYRATLPQARGEGEKMLAEAQAYRERKINEARGDAARFKKLVAEYRRAKDVTTRRLYIEAMEEVLPRIKKVVLDSANGKSPVDFGIFRTQ